MQKLLPGTLTIIDPDKAFNVTVTADPAEGGTPSADPASGKYDTKVTLSPNPAEGWQFKEWQIVSGINEITDNEFTIGTADVKIRAIYE